ncbi:MAG: sigma-70 family RNA polymerase sigma factor [Spirochaetales bacterium]|nr:sigma-70 family RNA polymerase sigma factor [Spirochaetales bacterium]
MRRISDAFGEERKKLFAFIHSKVSDREDAEDILQDVFTSAVIHLSVTEPVENLAAWLYTVAKNRIIDWYRKKRPANVSLDGEGEGVSLGDLIASGGLSVEEDFVRSVVTEALEDALGELPDNQREVFVLQAIEGKTFREISEETGTPLNTLIARKRYAVRFLKKRLAELKEMLDEYS